jgi:hypothetical protein
MQYMGDISYLISNLMIPCNDLTLTVWVTYMAMLVQFVYVVSLIRKALCNSATLRKLAMIWDLKMHCVASYDGFQLRTAAIGQLSNSGNC